MGPTAAGKTEVALRLAEVLPVEIISVDSAQVYRHLDIGTAKLEVAVREAVPHHLIDIRDPDEAYSAAEFHDDTLTLIEQINQRGRIPVLAGGTMLYFSSLMRGLSAMPPADPKVRERLDAEAARTGWSVMHQRLARIDPEAAARIHPHDPQRIQRALEVYEISGRPLSDWHRQGRKPVIQRPWLKLAIAPRQRADLHQRIANRFRLMLEQGLIEELRGLRQRYTLHAELPAMRSVGYRQAWQYLEGEFDEAGLVERGVAATRQLAKRQYTWLRRESGLVWYDLNDREVTQNITHTALAFVRRNGR
ncbi:MAG: tRNA (adenosine(37)-N6)-dimethylallyltransferase MiaA [Wenzhouxiangellaceae bacterium]